MKETAQRFIADLILSEEKNYVTIYEYQAFWKNTWKSIGKSIV